MNPKNTYRYHEIQFNLVTEKFSTWLPDINDNRNYKEFDSFATIKKAIDDFEDNYTKIIPVKAIRDSKEVVTVVGYDAYRIILDNGQKISRHHGSKFAAYNSQNKSLIAKREDILNKRNELLKKADELWQDYVKFDIPDADPFISYYQKIKSSLRLEPGQIFYSKYLVNLGTRENLDLGACIPIKVVSLNYETNELEVDWESGSGNEIFNLEHTIWAFERGEYFFDLK